MSMSCKMLLVCAHNGVLQIRQPQWKRQAILSLIRIEKWLPIYCCDCIRQYLQSIFIRTVYSKLSSIVTVNNGDSRNKLLLMANQIKDNYLITERQN